MKCKYCGKMMYCLKTWRDMNSGTVKGLFTCKCKKFGQKEEKYKNAIFKIRGSFL